MAYRAQMVIRTKDPRSVEVLEAVKKLAETRGKTISELAIEMFEVGLKGSSETTEEAEEDAEPVAVAQRPVVEPQESVKPKPDIAQEPTKHARSPETKELPRLVVVPDMGDEHTEKYLTESIRLVVREGVEAGAAVLQEFFASATPVQAGRLREELQAQLREAEFVALFDVLRETDAYRGYRKRVIYS